jgi:predicted membrane chloride channel (bestrophin family)
MSANRGAFHFLPHTASQFMVRTSNSSFRLAPKPTPTALPIQVQITLFIFGFFTPFQPWVWS